MKKLYFLLFFVLPLCSFSQTPFLVEKTMLGKLEPSDFETQKRYMINIDTSDSKEFMSGEITYYENKEALINKINNSLGFLYSKKIGKVLSFSNNIVYYPRKQHYSVIIENYRIDFWFPKNGSDKLECITLIKI